METIDDDIANRAVDFIQRQNKAGKPFFVWVNFTHMHFRTHPKPESIGQSGRWQSPYHDAMIDHDKNVGTVLKALDDLGIADNTFVMYSTDNGPHMNSWPDGAMTPFRSEKNSNWEGAYRVPAMVRWPGKIKPGQVSNEIVAHLDWLPTLLAIAGDTRRQGQAAQGLQGRRHDLQGPSRRRQPRALPDRARREEPAGIVLLHQRRPATDRLCATTTGSSCSWSSGRRARCASGPNPFTTLRVPKIFNLRTDPYERADITSNTYYDWLLDHAFLLVPAQDYVGEFLTTFKEYPPRQKAASFNMDEVMQKLKEPEASVGG